MRALKVTAIFVVLVIFGGALLAPLAYWLVQSLASTGGTMESLGRQPFHRYVNRAMLLLALAGLWPWARGMGMVSWRDMGWRRPQAPEWKLLGWGFLWGLASLAVFAIVAVASGAKVANFDHTAGEWVKRLFSATLSGISVALLEETLFRGGVFGGLRRSLGFLPAMLLASVIFASLHFLDRRPEPVGTVGWGSGIALLPRMVREIDDVRMFGAALGSLVLVGCFLCLSYERTGNLFFPVGLHAGWVFWMKITGFVTVAQPQAAGWLWGTGKLVDGWVVFGLLLVTFAWYWQRGRAAAASGGMGGNG